MNKMPKVDDTKEEKGDAEEKGFQRRGATMGAGVPQSPVHGVATAAAGSSSINDAQPDRVEDLAQMLDAGTGTDDASHEPKCRDREA